MSCSTATATLNPLDETATNRNLRLLSFEGGAYSLMVGVGETYLAALVIAVGLGDHLAGLITTLPVLGGACLQLVSFWGVKRFNSNQRWVAFAASVQALSAATISLFVLYGYASAWFLFLSATLYWFGGLAAGPAWSTWVEHLVSPPRRAAFFGARARICQVCVLVGILLGGGLLRVVDGVHIFAILFALAASCRFISALTIAMGTELPEWAPNRNESTTFTATLGSLAPETRRLIGYLLLMQIAVFIAAPFFTPYMLNHLGLGYVQYTWLISLGFVGKILAMPSAGRIAARHGAVCTLWIGGLGIIPMAGAWIFSESMAFLSVIQILGGAFWAFYELSTMLLFFEKISSQQRVAALSIYNVGTAMAMVSGSLIGGLLLQVMEASPSAYLVIFLVSSFARLAALTCIPKTSETTRMLRKPPPLRLIAVRPESIAWQRPRAMNDAAMNDAAMNDAAAEDAAMSEPTARRSVWVGDQVPACPIEAVTA